MSISDRLGAHLGGLRPPTGGGAARSMSLYESLVSLLMHRSVSWAVLDASQGRSFRPASAERNAPPTIQGRLWLLFGSFFGLCFGLWGRFGSFFGLCFGSWERLGGVFGGVLGRLGTSWGRLGGVLGRFGGLLDLGKYGPAYGEPTSHV